MNTTQEETSFVAHHVRDMPRSGIRDFFELVQAADDVISLGIGEPDFVTPWHIREAAIYALEKGKTSYTSNLGLLSLRKSVSKYIAKAFGVEYHPDNEILIAVGVSEASPQSLSSAQYSMSSGIASIVPTLSHSFQFHRSW